MTAYLFSKLCIKAGLPKGVLNILHGQGSIIGSKIVKHRDIKAISFTGGTATGEEIAKECSKTFKKEGTSARQKTLPSQGTKTTPGKTTSL